MLYKLKTEDKRPNQEKRQINITVDAELIKAFKVKCASYEFTMTDVLIDSIIQFVGVYGHTSKLEEGGSYVKK
jgi:NRPS condensation-like uncharacterized protein